MFRRSTLMRGGERTGPPVAAVGGPRRYNGLVPATDEGDESGAATRPTLLTTQAKAVLVVWGTVTLVLVITYAVVLVLL